MQGVTMAGTGSSQYYSGIRRTPLFVPELDHRESEFDSHVGTFDPPAGDMSERQMEREDNPEIHRSTNPQGREYTGKIAHLNERIRSVTIVKEYLQSVEALMSEPTSLVGKNIAIQAEGEPREYAEASPLLNRIYSLTQEFKKQAEDLLTQFNDATAAIVSAKFPAMDDVSRCGSAGSADLNLEDLKEFSRTEFVDLERLVRMNRDRYEARGGTPRSDSDEEIYETATRIRGTILAERERAFMGQANQDSSYILELLNMT